MNFNKQKKPTIMSGLWQRFVDRLTARVSYLLTKVIHIRTEVWLSPRMRRRIKKHKKADIGVYVDKQTHILWNGWNLVGHHSHSYNSLDIILHFVDTQPPQGYTRIVQILRDRTS